MSELKKFIQENIQKLFQEAGDVFNDAGEPMMTHSQFRDYSESSEPEIDDMAPDIEEKESDKAKNLVNMINNSGLDISARYINQPGWAKEYQISGEPVIGFADLSSDSFEVGGKDGYPVGRIINVFYTYEPLSFYGNRGHSQIIEIERPGYFVLRQLDDSNMGGNEWWYKKIADGIQSPEAVISFLQNGFNIPPKKEKVEVSRKPEENMIDKYISMSPAEKAKFIRNNPDFQLQEEMVRRTIRRQINKMSL